MAKAKGWGTLTGILACGIGATTSFGADFPDLKNHWSAPAVYKLADAGVVKGQADGLFHPNSKVTSAEAVVMVVKGLRLEGSKGEEKNLPSSDMPSWAKPYIKIASDRGILPESGFSGNRPATRAEIAALLAKGLRLVHPEPPSGSGKSSKSEVLILKDVKESTPHRVEIQTATDEGLITGYPDGTFRPDQSVTRSEAAQMIGRLRSEAGISTDRLGGAEPKGGTAVPALPPGPEGKGPETHSETSGNVPASTGSDANSTAPAASDANSTAPAAPVEPATQPETMQAPVSDAPVAPSFMEQPWFWPAVLAGLLLLGGLIYLALRPKRHIIAEPEHRNRS